ncbi:tyrosine-type recombinase/integrase [Leptolyngbya sp. PL-A3]|uniref:tyrosine-type recombinase/integrase n=1 Tax=Leptolyngbya sp. PL-A3 TaxID=2933911 RepID=UPI003299484D
MARKYQPRPENPNLKVRRPRNEEMRSREYLTKEEVDELLHAASARGRHKIRDHTLILLIFRHGLRASEAANLRWDAVVLGKDGGTISINRLKGSQSGNHPLQPDEVEALRELKEKYPDSRYLFPNERGEALSRSAIAKTVQRCGELAQFDFKVHPHMLRHACGYYLANGGAGEGKGLDTRLIQEWLGHRNIQHTVAYTRLNPERFKEMSWE